MKDLSPYKLLIFDLDGTLSEFKTGAILPNVKNYFDNIHSPKTHKLALAFNQGGVGLRYWMESQEFSNPEMYPNANNVEVQINRILAELGHEWSVYISYAYRSKKGQWSPMPIGVEQHKERWSNHWRKPQPGMLLQAMTDTGISPKETLMIGDWDEDRQAANNADCDFEYADSFFDRKQDIV